VLRRELGGPSWQIFALLAAVGVYLSATPGVLPGFYDYYIAAAMQAKRQRPIGKVRVIWVGGPGWRWGGLNQCWRVAAAAGALPYCGVTPAAPALAPLPSHQPRAPTTKKQSDLTLGKKLGSGAFGSVFKATLEPEVEGGAPIPVVVKKVRMWRALSGALSGGRGSFGRWCPKLATPHSHNTLNTPNNQPEQPPTNSNTTTPPQHTNTRPRSLVRPRCG